MTETIFKYRGLVWGTLAVAVLIFPVYPSMPRFVASIPILALGQALRFWAAGVIPKYRTLVVDAPELVTWGPYAFARNPLYAGNGIMGLGWSLMAGWGWAAAFAVLYIALYLMVIIPHEEKFLFERFGEEYEQYKKSTPAIFPRLANIRDKAALIRGFDAKKSWFMERHSLRMNIVVTILVLVRLYHSAK
ncbi:MAG: isoprenylcysteine carboxylmethyltransferase family protein [Synergistaceae bacterium]|nr:isoprenylcysteine carboxylmethyltransferase family protein [Synergistaceae bacterium]